MRAKLMHLEVLVEDQSGKTFLDIALQRIVADEHTFKVHPYKGIGRIPKNLNQPRDASKRILLDQLPRLLRGYGQAFAGYKQGYQAAVMVICDLDDKDLGEFLGELTAILDSCSPRPEAMFCLAIEEGEAWLLGDIPAIRRAFPNAKGSVLTSYVNDSICGTWEKLADAVYPGGAATLAARGWQAVGMEKARWAHSVTPHMNFAENRSPSFCHFHARVLRLLAPSEASE